MGISLMVKYLFSWSKVAVVPARRADTTAAPTFMRLLKGVEKNSRSRNDTSVPAAEP